MKEFLNILFGALLLATSYGYPSNDLVEVTENVVQIETDKIPCNKMEEQSKKSLLNQGEQKSIENIIHKATILTSPHDLKAVESTNNNDPEIYHHPGMFNSRGLNKDLLPTIKDEQSRKVRDVDDELPSILVSNSVPSQIRKENKSRARDIARSKLTPPVFIKSSPTPARTVPNIALLNQQLRNRIRSNVNKQKKRKGRAKHI